MNHPQVGDHVLIVSSQLNVYGWVSKLRTRTRRLGAGVIISILEGVEVSTPKARIAICGDAWRYDEQERIWRAEM